MESVTLTEAARRLGVGRRKVWAMVRDRELQVYADPLDKRRRLISQQAIENLLGKRGVARPWPRIIGAADLGIQSDEVEDWLEVNWRPC